MSESNNQSPEQNAADWIMRDLQILQWSLDNQPPPVIANLVKQFIEKNSDAYESQSRRIAELENTTILRDQIDSLIAQVSRLSAENNRLRVAVPPSDLLSRYEEWIKTIPVGEENQGHGASAYNWHRAALRKLRELSHEPSSTQTDEKGRPMTYWGGKADEVAQPARRHCGCPYQTDCELCSPRPAVETSGGQST